VDVAIMGTSGKWDMVVTKVTTMPEGLLKARPV
jgi:hypothetical protein